MLRLENIVKHYVTPGMTVEALKGITLSFRKSEFVSVLGPSGCGKTTLLNIIGGLDRYTSGDLYINNRSTKDFTDRDWDSYRNNSVGFVFQNYNLIPHQTVLSNVELALTLSGVSKQERRRRAIEALEKVGLHDQLNKLPNQLSGGQMQRVAIARAIVNDPDILLADEPTGALDSKTSIQILEILKEISKERLVIMVTHNSDLAYRYSSRIIQLKDGEVISDTNPPTEEESKEPNKVYKLIKTSMSFVTALMLSLKNLISKKGRTILTALAGSIGIIGIALVLSISYGFDKYIQDLQSNTLSEYPLTIKRTALNINVMDQYDLAEEFPDDLIVKIRERGIQNFTHSNKIDHEYVEYLQGLDSKWYHSIRYMRNLDLNIIVKNGDNYLQLETGNFQTQSPFLEVEDDRRILKDLIDNYEFIKRQYDVYGSLPQEPGDLVLIIDKYNQIDRKILEALGYEITDENKEVSFDDLYNLQMRLVFNDDYYQYIEETNSFTKKQPSEQLFNIKKNLEVKIVGILRVKENVDFTLFGEGLYYSPKLAEEFLKDAKNSHIVSVQKEVGYTRNVLEGDSLVVKDEKTFNLLMQRLGGDDLPHWISIYPKDIESKEAIKEYLNKYNENKSNEEKIIIEDLSEAVTRALRTLINTISYVLIVFAAISLVVSSIMIGIITYVSVIERTKEIGVLRSIGARKKDISRVFNAETIIIGFTAGVIGITIAYILTVPINIIINSLAGDSVRNISQLNPIHALILVLISMILTLISGLIPARIAANKDPVVALRTE